MTDINQDEIDALLGGGQTVEDETGSACSVDDIVSQVLDEQVAPESEAKQAPAGIPEKSVPQADSGVEVDTSALAAANEFEQTRAAQKILFEVFSSISDKKERARLLNWANDAFIKSKYF